MGIQPTVHQKWNLILNAARWTTHLYSTNKGMNDRNHSGKKEEGMNVGNDMEIK